MAKTLDACSESDFEAAWSEEIKRRLAEVDAATVELIPLEDVRAELFAQPNATLTSPKRTPSPRFH